MSLNYELNVILIVGFLLLNLIVGLYYGRNVRTIRDYALGNKKFSTSTIVATIVATWIGGSDFALSISETYKNGIWYILAGAGYALNLMVVAFLFNNKIPEFDGSVSVAETMGKLYGKHVRFITAVASIASTMVVLALQIKVFSTIFSYFLGVSGIYATIISSFVIITYSAFGGINSVTFTDVLQFVTFGVVIPVFAVFIWNVLGNSEVANNVISHKLFSYHEILTYNSEKSFKYISIFLCGLVPAINPTMFQRMLLAESKVQTRQCFIISSCACMFIYLITCFIGFVVYYHDPNLNPEHLGLYIIDNYSLLGLKSIAIIGIISMIMSTADSWINTASIIFSHDICVPLNIGNKNELLLSRLFSIFLGVGVVMITLNYDHLLDLLFLSENLYIPVVTPILMLAILNFRSTTRVALLAIAAGIIVATYWKYNIQEFTGIESVIPGMLANFLCFFSAHYILKEPGGWIKSGELKKSSKKKSYKKMCIGFIDQIKSFELLKYCNKKLPTNNIIYTYFSFATFLTIITTISIEKQLYHRHLFIINFFQVIALIISTFFMCCNLYQKSFKAKYMGIIWYLSIFIALGFISSFLVLLSDFSHVALAILTIHLTMIPILLDWKTALTMILSSLLLSLAFYQSIESLALNQPDELTLKLLYVLFIVAGFSITFLKTKQEYLEETEEKAEHFEKQSKYLKKEIEYSKREFENLSQGLKTLENQFKEKQGVLKEKEIYLREQLKIRNIEISKLKDLKDEFIRNIEHESRTPLTGILSLCDILYSYYDKLDKKDIKRSIKDIVNSGDRLKSYVNNISDLSKLSALSYELNKEKVNLSKLVKERTVLYKKVFSDDVEKQKFRFEIEEDIIVECDEYYMTQAIDNLISNAVKYGEGNPVTIRLIRTRDNQIQFKIIDLGIGIPEDELISIFDKFTVSSTTKNLAEGRGIGLALCEKIIKAHKGRIWAEQNANKGSTFTFVLGV